MKAATVQGLGISGCGCISIHAAREGGDVWKAASGRGIVISIHAAREGGDTDYEEMSNSLFISIHAAREGGDVRRHYATNQRAEFQSTPPVKAATLIYSGTAGFAWISIHAAREGGD